MDHEPRQDGPRWDATDSVLKVAFQDVAVPDGLAGRLLDRLAEARRDLPLPGSAAAVPEAGKTGTAPICAEHPEGRSGKWGPGTLRVPFSCSRRRVLLAVGAFSAMAAVAVGVLLRLHRAESETPRSILEHSVQFFAVEAGEQPVAAGAAGAAHWLSKEPPPAEYPISREVLRGPRVRWRMVERFLSRPAVAYDLGEPGGPRATLYVTRRTVAGLPAFPPTAPVWSTAGRSAAAWQTQNTLYVLVVEGDLGAYRNCLDVSGTPVT
jgi:hypothetical protein